MLNYVDKFYLFCKKFSIFISVAFLIVFFGCLFTPMINIDGMPCFSLQDRFRQFILFSEPVVFPPNIPLDKMWMIDNVKAAIIYHGVCIFLLLGSLIIDILCLIKKKRTYYLLPIGIFATIIIDYVFPLIAEAAIVGMPNFQNDYAPSTAFYLTLAFLLLQVGFNVFMRTRHQYYLAHDGEPTYPPRKPRAVKPPKPHKPTQRERIDELQREIEELKKRDA